MRRAARTDNHHSHIVDALRKAGYSVQSLAGVGKGVPDLLVARAGRMWLLEVKSPPGPRGGTSQDGQHLAKLQEMWQSGWAAKVGVVRTVEEALQYLNAIQP